jgi:hypothetical protein
MKLQKSRMPARNDASEAFRPALPPYSCNKNISNCVAIATALGEDASKFLKTPFLAKIRPFSAKTWAPSDKVGGLSPSSPPFLNPEP